MNPRPTAAGVRGFTMIEVMITVAVVAILGMIAIPPLRAFTNEHRSRAAMGALTADLNFARLEAIKRNAHVLVCPRNGTTTNCLVSNNWATGWVVCYDANSDATCDVPVDAAVDPNPLKVQNPIDATLTLTATGSLVNFAPIGTASSGQVIFTLTNSTATRTGTVLATGSVSSKKN